MLSQQPIRPDTPCLMLSGRAPALAMQSRPTRSTHLRCLPVRTHWCMPCGVSGMWHSALPGQGCAPCAAGAGVAKALERHHHGQALPRAELQLLAHLPPAACLIRAADEKQCAGLVARQVQGAPQVFRNWDVSCHLSKRYGKLRNILH